MGGGENRMCVGLAAMSSCYKSRSARGASEHGVLPDHAIVPLTWSVSRQREKLVVK